MSALSYRLRNNISQVMILAILLCLSRVHAQFATNFKCNEIKQSNEYVRDVKNYINEISEYFDSKKSIERLDLSTIGLGFLKNEDFVGTNYKHITSLNLSKNIIKTISFSFLLRFPNLHDLDISQNCLISLDINHRIIFKNLSSLNASRNSISNIHPFTFSNVSLDVVDLSHNHLIRFLAADFEIQQLYINDNKLTQIEIDSGHRKELKMLDARNNNLKIFQINVDLNNLILSNNQLTMDDYFSIRNVYGTLDMSMNDISEFNWKLISCVTNLDISHNQLTMLSIGCPSKRFQRLKRLNMNGNFLCNFNEAQHNITRCFPNLKFISIMHNRLNKAQRIDIKSTLGKMKVKSQIFDYDVHPITSCYDDDADDCVAFDIFFRKFE